MLFLLGGLAGGPAVAGAIRPVEDPFMVNGRVSDLAGVLTRGEVTEITTAIDSLGENASIDLFVVYVDTYTGSSPADWAGDTAELSGMGRNDVLLTVAVEDRMWSISTDNDSALTQGDAEELFVTSGERDLARDDWAQAPISYAQAIESHLVDPNPPPGAPGGAAQPVNFGLILAITAGVAAVAYFLIRGRRSKHPEKVSGSKLEQLPLPELSKRAGAALVQVDNELRSSEQELGFAQAQFGLQATESYSRTLAQAKKDATAAFEAQKKLDDTVPDTDAEKRKYYLTIINISEKVHQALMAEKKSFDELRAMESRAGEVLEQMGTRADEVAARVEGARSVVASLSGQYTPSALASVSENPDQADSLLHSARQAITAGQERLAAEDRSSAVVNARIAEQAIDSAAKLLDEVNGANTALKEAGPKLEAALESITADVRDANRLAPSDQNVVAARDAAQLAIESGISAQEGGDPLAALQQLGTAEARLDKVLEGYRQRAEVVSRTQGLFDQQVDAVRHRVARADALVTANRGAMDTRPRTLASEAARYLADAESLRSTDPERALAALNQAGKLASDAIRVAEQQRDDFPWKNSTRGGGGGGGIDVGSLILGGILSDMLDPSPRSRGRRGGGSWGGGGGGLWGSGGGSWGSSRPSSRGSFGGSFGGGLGGGRSGGGRSSGGGRF